MGIAVPLAPAVDSVKMGIMSDHVVAPYGTWESPISAADVAGGLPRVALATLVSGQVWWTEARPAEGGRMAVLRGGTDAAQPAEMLLPDPWYARTRVHEYGGRSWIAVPGGGGIGSALVFCNFSDQRVYKLDLGFGGEPVALTPEPAQPSSVRYANLTPAPGGTELWCVRETHDGDQVRRDFAAIPLDGSGDVRSVGTDTHFLDSPRFSPDGRRLAWIGWEHPNMPWDGTVLRVADITADGMIGTPWTILGGDDESVLQPEWADSQTLYAISDRGNWWNLYRIPASGGGPEPLCPLDEEFAGPAWVTGTCSYAVLDDSRIAVVHGRGSSKLGLLDPATGLLEDLDLSYTDWDSLHSDGRLLAVVAASPTEPKLVLLIDPSARSATVVHTPGDYVPDPAYLPIPEAVVFTGPTGRDIHANVYPPTHPHAIAPDGELPPYVVHVHGGPTALAPAVLSLGNAYFTSRGIGVLDVNYGGSTGYGRAYRNRLRGQWGIGVLDVNYGGSTGYGRAYRNRLRGQWGVVDVEDAVAAVTALADAGRADRGRLAINGKSAGGWTTLAALVGSDVFACGASYFGVSDLIALAEDTHDFESRYLDSLVGPLPEALDVYTERAPVNRVDGLNCPVLLLQGEDDPVVPPSQAEKFAEALADKGIPYGFLLFAGEQHGFRKPENNIAALEAELSFYGQVMGFAPDVPVVPLTSGRDPETGRPFVTRQ